MGQNYSLATSTQTVRNWLDQNLFTIGGTVFSEGNDVNGLAASTRGVNRLDLFWMNAAGKLIWKAYDNGWAAPVDLGAPAGVSLTGKPASVSWSSSRIDVFVRGSNNTLWQRFFANGSWVPGWFPIGGAEATSSPAVSSWGPNRLDVFVRRADDALWHTWYDNGWGSWESLGGVLTSAPAAVSWGPGRIDVVVRGGGNQVFQKWYQNGWQPSQTGFVNLGGNIDGDPGLASSGPNRLDIYAKGSDQTIKRRWYNNAWLESWTSTGIQAPCCGGPAAVSWGPGRVDLFVTEFSGRVWQSFFPRP